MSYNRETWEEVSFQVFEDEGGAIRSGYYPTGTGLVTGNIAVDFVHGKHPLQPNEDRGIVLGVGDSHKVAAVEWDSYPETSKISANYMVTAAVGDGSEITYTAQNKLLVGDVVTVKGLDASAYNVTEATVTYADVYKFKVSDSSEAGLVTGQYGRVDVVSDTRGGTTTGEGGPFFYFPSLWFCDDAGYRQNKLSNVINELVAIGVPSEYLVDFTFSGGENEWDTNGEPNYDGAIFYAYVPADEVIGTDWLNQPIYGSALDGVVWGSESSAGSAVAIDGGNPGPYVLYVFSNDPRKDNVWWWLY